MEEIVSEGLRLSAHFARPPGVARVPALLVLPGFPRGAGGAAALGNTDATLCDRVAREAGWAGLTFTFRGTGPSEGDFSIDGWLADVRAAVDALDARARRDRCVDRRASGWAGRSRSSPRRATSGCAASRRSPRRRRCARGCASPTGSSSTRGAPACCAATGYPADPDAWIRAIANLDPVDAARHVAPRPWLLVHGSADDVVPVDDARRLADAAGAARGAADRRERPASAAARSARDRRAARLARSPERLKARLSSTLREAGAGVVEHGGERLGRGGRRATSRCRRAAAIASPTSRGTSTGRTSVRVDGDPQRSRVDAATRCSAISRTDTPVPEHTL